jgi:hypothetical protein
MAGADISVDAVPGMSRLEPQAHMTEDGQDLFGVHGFISFSEELLKYLVAFVLDRGEKYFIRKGR